MIEPEGITLVSGWPGVKTAETVRAKGVRLKVQLQSQLYLSRRVCLSRHFAECRGSDGQIRRGKLWVVQRVEGFGAELQQRAFA